MIMYYISKGIEMNKFIASSIVLFFVCIISIYGDPIENTVENDKATNVPRIFFMPIVSYTFISFDAIQSHNAIGGLTLYRFDPNERGKSFSASLIYTPQIVTNINHDFPNVYHTAAFSIIQKINRHTINGTFVALTEKPIYGGLHTFMGMAGYSYDLINGPHFSMDLGGRLIFMDIGLTLDNGMPWLLWPIPSINLSWEYKWITFGFIPGARTTIAPNSPISLIGKAGSHKIDLSLWYRFLRNGNPSAEIMGIAIGIKKDSSNVMISDGGKYGINYDAIYGTLRLLRLFEISGGWTFNGKEGYEKNSWETLFESEGYSDNSMYNGNIGNGFFVSVSARMVI
jgi:hypothetical protein